MAKSRIWSVLVPGSDNSEHVAVIEPSPRRVRLFFRGVAVADSKRPQLLIETGRLPVYYFPIEDVRMDHMVATGHKTVCPYKGNARHWSLRVGDREAENAAWSYPTPKPDGPDLTDLVAFRWEAADAWREEDEEVFGHPRSPYHRVDVVESSRRVEVKLDGMTVADSRRPRLLFETGLPTRYYLPTLDVRLDLLRPESRKSRCPYKGVASYWSVVIEDKKHENVVWCYETSIPEAPKLAGLFCFLNERSDIYVDGELQERPATPWS